MKPLLAIAARGGRRCALDQWSRRVESTPDLHEQIDLLPFFALFRTYNFGIAFSMFSSGFSDQVLVVLHHRVVGVRALAGAANAHGPARRRPARLRADPRRGASAI
jgi:hypothetical protein